MVFFNIVVTYRSSLNYLSKCPVTPENEWNKTPVILLKQKQYVYLWIY